MVEMLESVEWINERDAPPSEARGAQGAACLPHILDGSLKRLIDSADFENDTLFCSWTYFVDWDKREVQVRSNHTEVEGVRSFAELNEEWMQELQNRYNKEVGNEAE